MVHLMSSVKPVNLKALSKCANVGCRTGWWNHNLKQNSIKLFEDYALESGQSNYYARNSLSILSLRVQVFFLHVQGMWITQLVEVWKEFVTLMNCKENFEFMSPLITAMQYLRLSGKRLSMLDQFLNIIMLNFSWHGCATYLWLECQKLIF